MSEKIDPETIVPEEILEEMTDYAVENQLIDEEYADKFPAKLMSMIMPSQDDVAHTYNRLHALYDREQAKRYLLRIAEASLFVKKKVDDQSVAWMTHDGKHDFAVVMPVIDRVDRITSNGFYPKCPYCIENLGFCGLPGEQAWYNKRVLPLEIGPEKWYFSYVSTRYFSEEFIVSSATHRPSDGRDLARMLDIAEKFPDNFVFSDGEVKEHDHLWGGRTALPFFKSPIRKVILDGDLSIEIPEWCFSFLRVRSYDKPEALEVGSKIIKYWKNFRPGNIVYFVVHCTINQYVVDICLLNEGKPNLLFDKPRYIDVLGMFTLPSRMHADVQALASELSQPKIDFAKINEDPELEKYLEWVIQIAAARGTGMTYKQAGDSLVSLINETCIKTSVDFSVTDKELEKVANEILKKK